MSESYTTGADYLHLLDPTALIGQTFSPLREHKLQFIDLNLKRLTQSGGVSITLHNLTDDPNMVGGGISHTRYVKWSERMFYDVSRVRFTMRKQVVKPGTTYGILIHHTRTPWWNYHHVQGDVNDAAYPRGQRFTKANWADPPTYYPNDDLMFTEFGDPPSPPPIPPTPDELPSPVPSMALMDMLISSEEIGLDLIQRGIIDKPLEHEMEAALAWKRALLHLLENIVVGIYPTEAQLTNLADECNSFSEYYYYLLPYPEDWEWPLTYEEVEAFAEAYADLHDYLVAFLAWLTEEPPPIPPPPPPPPAPPDPPIDNFMILDVIQEDTGEGIRFRVTTNVPCHLYMLWTNHEPWTHVVPGIRRGVAIVRDVKYCFVDWIVNEQAQPGDTIYHTFVKEPWAVCETRWFTFRAKVNDLWTPSVGPIFKKHRIAPRLPTHKYDHSGGGKHALSAAGNFYASWVAPIASAIYNNLEWIQCGFYGLGINPPILRSYLLFDTTTLPPDKQIYSGKIHFHHGWGWVDPADFDLVLQNGQPTYPHVPIEVGDYFMGHYSGEGGRVNKSLIHDHQPFDIPLNAQGLSWIRPGDYTKLCIRTSLDIEGINPWTDTESRDIRCMMRYYYNNKWDLPELWLGYD